jgi:hypothetical protein
MRHRVLTLSLLIVSSSFTQACGGDSGAGVTPDDGSVDSTTDDTGTNDTGTGESGGDDTGTNDTGTSDTGATDAGDGGAKDSGSGNVVLQCPDGGATTDCAQCTGAPQPCVYCDMNDASALQGVCTPMHQNCFQNIPNGFEDCRCMMDASTCPEGYQVCTVNDRCHTCSDQNGNDMLKCQNGGTCNYADGGCL